MFEPKFFKVFQLRVRSGSKGGPLRKNTYLSSLDNERKVFFLLLHCIYTKRINKPKYFEIFGYFKVFKSKILKLL